MKQVIKIPSLGDAENTVLGQLLIGMGVELDRFGTGNIAKTMTAIIGSKYGSVSYTHLTLPTSDLV